MPIQMKSSTECKFDLISLGEVMLRFDPGNHPIRSARTFQIWEGGGEYNVARGSSSCFNQRTAIVTVLVENEIGSLVKNLIQQGGVDTSLIQLLPFDGIGQESRNGIYFLEKGFGIRNALSVSDRGHTGISQLKKGTIDWEDIFVNKGAKFFHTGGVFAGLSDSSPDVIEEAMKIAKKSGTIISYDLNYRQSLWQEKGGKKRAMEVNRRFAPYIDILFGVENLNNKLDKFEFDPFEEAIKTTHENYPDVKIIASTMRQVISANVNDWSGLCYMDGKFHRGIVKKKLDIFDRVGGGDGFAAGFLYGLSITNDLKKAIDYAIAHGALTMSTPGDNSMSSISQVEKVIQNQSATVKR